MSTIATPNGTLTNGKTYRLVLAHGTTRREIEGRVVEFEVGQTVYDGDGHPIGRDYTIHYRIDAAGQSVGFLPENVLSVEAI